MWTGSWIIVNVYTDNSAILSYSWVPEWFLDIDLAIFLAILLIIFSFKLIKKIWRIF